MEVKRTIVSVADRRVVQLVSEEGVYTIHVGRNVHVAWIDIIGSRLQVALYDEPGSILIDRRRLVLYVYESQKVSAPGLEVAWRAGGEGMKTPSELIDELFKQLSAAFWELDYEKPPQDAHDSLEARMDRARDRIDDAEWLVLQLRRQILEQAYEAHRREEDDLFGEKDAKAPIVRRE